MSIVPRAVTNLNASATSSNDIFVNWDEPMGTNDAIMITGYRCVSNCCDTVVVLNQIFKTFFAQGGMGSSGWRKCK